MGHLCDEPLDISQIVNYIGVRKPMLELRNVCKHYSSIPAVEDVSFSARAGEVTGYLGPNGSGKSTTIKMITGLIEMSSGSILFQGRPIQADLMASKNHWRYVP